MKHMS